MLIQSKFVSYITLLIYCFNIIVCSCNKLCSKELSIDITDGTFDANSNTYEKDGITYDSSNYFEEDGMVKGCICNLKICVRKCCALDEYLDGGSKNCTYNEDTRNFLTDLPVSESMAFPYYVLITDMLHCDDGTRSALRPENNSDQNFLINANGFMLFRNGEYRQDDYCLDYISRERVLSAVFCVSNGAIESAFYLLRNAGMIISMPFLLATFLVYALLPDRNLPAKALMCYVLSLLFAYILLVTIQLDSQLARTPCVTLAFFCYFFFMASFFWMNASCLDIFFTFSGIRGLLGDKKKENRRFMYYSAYAWGIPILMVGFAAIFTFQEEIENSNWHTGIGNGQCWFKNGWPTGIYFYFPIATLLIVNIVLFGVTTYKIKKVQHDTKMLKNVDSRKHRKYDNNDKQRFNLYVKLLFAMGINWSMEVISWAIMWKWATVPDYVWVLTDFCNAVYGVFIFFIFVFKRNIWMMLKKRYLQFTGRPQQAHTLTSVNRTTVSQVSSSEA